MAEDDAAAAAAASRDMVTADGAAPLKDNVGALSGMCGEDDADVAALDDDAWLAAALGRAAAALGEGTHAPRGGGGSAARSVASQLAALSFNDDEGAESGGRSDRDDDVAHDLAGTVDGVQKGEKEIAGGWGRWEGDRTLLVDNYDSYTFNLYHLIAAVDGVPPVVVSNDHFGADADAAWRQLAPALTSGHFTRVVLSPGPGTPDRGEDIGICGSILSHAADTPVLGVCLGHQALAAVHGGKVVRAPVPMHGRLHHLEHDGSGLFEGVPSGDARDAEGRCLTVVRYHSLVVDATSMPPCLEAIAWTMPDGGDGGGVPAGETEENKELERRGGVIMAMRHRSRPHYGVQFHPESVCSEFGEAIYRNFARLAAEHWSALAGDPKTPASAADERGEAKPAVPRGLHPAEVATAPSLARVAAAGAEEGDGSTKLLWMKLPRALGSIPGGTEAVYWGLYGGTGPAGKTETSVDTFWLDSATAATAAVDGPKCPRSRFSFMGGKGGALWRRAVYRLPPPHAVSQGGAGIGGVAWRTGAPPPFEGGRLEVEDSAGARRVVERTSLMGWLDARLQSRRCARAERVASWGEAAAARAESGARNGEDDATGDGVLASASSPPAAAANAEEEVGLPNLPFDFWGGFVGYLGYELRVECGSPPPRHASPLPDAALFLADRVVAADHDTGDVYIMALVADSISQLTALTDGLSGAAAAVAAGMVEIAAEEAEGEARAWMTATERAILGMQSTEAAARALDGSAAAAGLPAMMAVAEARRLMEEDRAEATEEADGGKRRLPSEAASFALRRGQEGYVADIEASQRAIDAGETYEVCLTNQMHRMRARNGKVTGPSPENLSEASEASSALPGAPDPGTLYTVLRHTNPSPYGAFLNIGGCDGGGGGGGKLKDTIAVCCSSPERFLRLGRPDVDEEGDEIGGGTLEAKPIKGTAPRRYPLGCAADVAEAESLARSVKDRAENLMIVDLLRNDLGRVCVPGSVHVPGLMKIESYATVHQLVSTVRGERLSDVSPVACVRAAFPGGSMTGAPKFRTMEIIDSLEPGARGVYSGSVGFFSVNGAFDLNIVIRTAVVRPGTEEVWIGSGGAITALSDPTGEWEEMTLKASAVLRAVRACDAAEPKVGGRVDGDGSDESETEAGDGGWNNDF